VSATFPVYIILLDFTTFDEDPVVMLFSPPLPPYGISVSDNFFVAYLMNVFQLKFRILKLLPQNSFNFIVHWCSSF
jgi:hypothetical protein